MKVLLVNHSPEVSGAEHSILELASGLIEAGHSAAVACPPGRFADLAATRGLEVTSLRFPAMSFRRDVRMLARASVALSRGARDLRRAVRALRPDIVHANSVRAGLLAGPALAGLPTPLIVHVRDRLPDSAAGRLAGLAATMPARAVLANSAFTVAGLPPRARAKTCVIDNPVDVRRFQAGGARQRSGAGDSGPLLAVVGQITPWKRQHLAIEALARLLPAHPGARLVIAGDAVFNSASTRLNNSAYRDSLRELASALGVGESVTFLGRTDAVEQVMGAADVLLVPSENEPFGRVIVEAMIAGTPVVASRSGGPRELIDDGVTGVLAADDTPEEWARAVSRLLADRRRSAAISAAAREFAQDRFSRERVTRATLELYESMLR